MARQRIEGEILKGHVATLVLSVIGDRPRHGYDIMRVIFARSEGVFELGQGTIYPLLYALEEEGLVKSRDELVDGRRRRTYFLTHGGRKALSERKETWKTFQAAINSILEPARMGVLSHVRI